MYVHEHQIEGGYLIGTVNLHLKELEGAGIIKLNNLLVKVGFMKGGQLHGYCIIYKDGLPQSLQQFEDGQLIQDTHHITKITIANQSSLPDDRKGVNDGYNTSPRFDRKLNGFIFQDDIMEGSYGYHSYLLDGDKMIEEGCFMNGLLSNIGTQQNGWYQYKATGEWKDAQLNGEGLKVYENGRIEFGTFEDRWHVCH